MFIGDPDSGFRYIGPFATRPAACLAACIDAGDLPWTAEPLSGSATALVDVDLAGAQVMVSGRPVMDFSALVSLLAASAEHKEQAAHQAAHLAEDLLRRGRAAAGDLDVRLLQS